MGLREGVMTAELVRLRSARRTDPPASDEELALACAYGDAQAISALFERYRRPVARYVHRLLAGSSEVEDVVQSTFLEVARGKSAYDARRASVLTWLFAIATYVVRHQRRSQGRRHRLLAALRWESSSAPIDPGANFDARRRVEQAKHALEQLSPKLREAFVLCELEGLTAEQAGIVLGISEVAVWKRVSKARQFIRRTVLGGSHA